MKKKFNLDAATFKFFYTKYKEYLLPLVVILVCIGLFIFVLIPGIQNLFYSQQEAKVEAEKLTMLRNNLNTLNNLSDTQLDSQLQIVASALPPNKDFAGILNAIGVAANNSGVILGDYNFSVGDITNNQSFQPFPSLQLTLTISAGGINSVIKFVSELYKTVPISEVSSIRADAMGSQITVLFYYRPFPSLDFSDSQPLAPLSSKNLSIINQLSTWNNAGGNIQPTLVLPTPSVKPASGL
jgi:hypothetical protein